MHSFSSPHMVGRIRRRFDLFRAMVANLDAFLINSFPCGICPGHRENLSRHTGRQRIMGSSHKAALVMTVLEAD